MLHWHVFEIPRDGAGVNEWSNGEVPEHARPLVEEVERALAESAVMHTFHGKKHG